jgi:molybdopterin-binding protein
LSAFLTIEGLKHSYEGRRVLDVDFLEIFEGELLAVIGPNGSGKSTLLRIINLLEKPDTGELTFWNGDHLSSMSRLEKKELSHQMAMIFQEPLLFKRSVKANIAYGLRVRRLPREEKDKRVREMLERLDLGGFSERDAMTLSGGEAQKVTLARAMVLRPRLLLMDEPLASLDVPTRKMLRHDISYLVREMGVSAVYVTHDYHEVLEIADRLAVLIDGSLLQVGNPGQVFGHPATDVVADFLGAENLLEGTVLACKEGLATIEIERVSIEAICGEPPGSRIKVLIHPEEVALLSDSGGTSSMRNRLPARVVDVKSIGALVKVSLECGFPLVAYITMASRDEMDIEPGKRVTVAVKAAAIHAMPFTSATQ